MARAWNYVLANEEKGGWNGRWTPVPGEIREEGEGEGRKQRKHRIKQLIRPQSRGLRAYSDVSRFAVDPDFHCGQV
jgi:hypothetical protein